MTSMQKPQQRAVARFGGNHVRVARQVISSAASLLVLWGLLLALGCDRQKGGSVGSPPGPQISLDKGGQDLGSEPRDETGTLSAERVAYIDEVRPRVEAFCGDCHAMPRPASSTKEMWVEEVNQGFTLYGKSGRNDLVVPSYEEVLKFFQYQAPTEIKLPPSIDNYPACTLNLELSGVRMEGPRPPGITNVRWIDLGIGNSATLVYCDIGTGMVKGHWPNDPDRASVRLSTLLQPVHVESCDLDSDGLTDLVVADIGEFNAEDSQLGRVVWLRRKEGVETFDKIVIRDGLSRVADVQPGDFDSDGDVDLLVGVFGWRATGEILLLENQGINKEGVPEFKDREIDSRHGAVNVPCTDLNGDGHLDFVALLSQEHEVVDAFINDGSGNFTTERIWSAPDPAYGSSGIELTDLDGDGDQDILFTNGDSFDRGAKPYHSVQWLENNGGYPYVHHHICEMPGVLNATAGDFDGDGDEDVVAVALLAGDDYEELVKRQTSSVVFLQQMAPGEFARFQVEAKTPTHLSVEAGDFNEDGKLDFAVGTFLRSGAAKEPDLQIWSVR